MSYKTYLDEPDPIDVYEAGEILRRNGWDSIADCLIDKNVKMYNRMVRCLLKNTKEWSTGYAAAVLIELARLTGKS